MFANDSRSLGPHTSVNHLSHSFRRAKARLAGLLEGAGLAHWEPEGFIVRLIAACTVLGLWSFAISRLVIFSVCIAVLVGAFGFELLVGRARNRRREIAKMWPEVLDSLASAEVAGIGLVEAFADLAEHAPASLQAHFVRANAKLIAGFGFDRVMRELKTEVGEVHADRLIELVRMVHEIGSTGYHSLLREQSRSLRADLALSAEIETKQSWVLGTAKLALAAPWLIVALLSSRFENAAVYSSSGGSAILLGGLLLSAFAYWLIHRLGSLPQSPRVLR